jgi:membrane dipeptidase
MKYFICFYGFLFYGFLAMFSCAETQKKNEEGLEAKARRIHEQTITIDTHNEINVNNFTDSVNYTQRLETQINLPKTEEGGLDVSWLIVYTGPDTLTAEGYA